MLKLALVDPSVFTEDYDLALFAALQTIPEIRVDLYGSPKARSALFEPFFFRPRLLHRAGRKAWSLPIKAAWYVMDLVRFYRRATRYQIVHFQWACIPLFDRFFIALLRRAGVKAIFTVHDPRPFNLAPSSRYQLLGWRRLLATFDHLIVHSEQGLAELRRLGLSERRCDVIPIGVLHFPKTNQHYRGTLDPSKVNLLMFGALKPYKGLDLLLGAVRYLDKALKAKLHVVIAGEPYIPLADHYAYCKAHDLDGLISWDLRFIDASELDHLFQQADIMCFPYREVDASGVLMAAIRYGKAIVAANVGAFGVYLTHDETALLFPPGDVDQLTKQLARVVADTGLRRRLGDNLRTVASAQSWESVAASTAALYERLVEAEL